MKRANSTAAVLTVFSLLATPVAAAERPSAASSRGAWADAPMVEDDAMTADWRHGWRYRRHRGIDLGDVLTSVLIIGGIAAVADAARDSERERIERRRDDDRDYDRDGDYQRRDRSEADRYARTVSASEAAESCMDEASRFGTVDDFDLVRRLGDGWQIEGLMADGTPYSCTIDLDGRVRELGRGSARDEGYSSREDFYGEDDAQGDVDYAAARARLDRYAYRGPVGDDRARDANPGGAIDSDIEG